MWYLWAPWAPYLSGCLDPTPPKLHTEAHLTEDPREIRYPITGTSWSALMRSMTDQAEALNLGREGDRQFYGRGLWNLTWKEKTTHELLGCRLDIDIAMRTTTFLPEWKAPEETAPSLQEQWDSWLVVLKVHEQGHQDISLDTARRFRAEAQALMPGQDCTSMKTELDALGKQFSDRCREAQEAYDVLTDHGRQQERWTGVVEPAAGG